MRFFDRTRTALARYAAGVHNLAAPATRAVVHSVEQRLGRDFPESYREFLLQWNGGWLFHDDYTLFGVTGAPSDLDRIARSGDLFHIGLIPAGDLFLDDSGRTIARDAETESRRIEGSDFERWLEATLSREGVLYDREGEFRDDAFDGDELSDAARKKRALLSVKADAASPAWREELGLVYVEEDQPDKALVELEHAIRLDPTLASAWAAIARLRRAAGAFDAAAEAFALAAACEPDADEQAFAWAQAARAATDSGTPALVEKAPAWAALAISLAPRFASEQRAAAEHLADEGDVAGAIERMALAVAVHPDPELRSLLSRLRARAALKLISG